MNYNPQITALALSRLPRFGPIKFQQLIAELANFHPSGSIDELLAELPIRFANLFVNFEQSFEQIYQEGEKIYGDLVSKGIGLIHFGDVGYPGTLSQIPDPPIVLFYCGNVDLLKSSNLLSIVGTRKISDYGEDNLRTLMKDISQCSPIIVSGMAFGIDAIAHESAMAEGLKTIAVLPTSADTAYPPSHKSLYQKIISKEGLILSETIPNEEFHKGFLPRRNRIIAGLSKATVVVEAGIPSGATITAEMAFDYGREVFCFPGGVRQSTMAGCNLLIKSNKAQLMEAAADIVHLFGDVAIKPRQPVNLTQLTEIESEIYHYLNSQPREIEEICTKFDISIQNTLSLLVGLEMKDLITKNNDLKYLAIK